MRIVRRLQIRFKNAVSNSLRPISSSSALIQQHWRCYYTDEDLDGKSAPYKCPLKLQPPATIQYEECLHNCVSLIGTIKFPLRACKSTDFGVYTILRVNASYTGACGNLCTVMLKFWDELAEISTQHLKPNDLVYVSGCLGSYKKVDASGKSMQSYEVNVKELKFVAQLQHGPGPADQNLVKFEPEASFEDMMQKRRERLHLWQIFFANPFEWWDNRNRKTNPKHPDL